MAGGLLQIASYGSQDIYLTGNPEITFFKIVYRRHTNFSVESIEIPFDDVQFGDNSVATVPFAGDLITKIYVKIVLPKLNFKRVHSPTSDFKTNYDKSKEDYYTVQNYVRVMTDAYRIALEDYEASNVLYAETMYESIEQYFISNGGFNSIINSYILLSHVYAEEQTNIRTIASKYSNTYDGNTPKQILMDKINTAIYKMNAELKDYFYEMLNRRKLYEDDINDKIKIAWVDRIGHNIIEYVDILIGGNRIDRHYGEWLTIWHELTASPFKEEDYRKMIGDIPVLTNFDREHTPEYTLYVPLQFWFCRHNGLALPLIALQYTDVTLNVKFRDFRDLVYVNTNETILFNDEEFSITELTDDEGVVLHASLLVDYVFLDSPERRRFAQSAHEYLIDQVQMLEFSNITHERLRFPLDFFHPTKEIVWTVQKDRYRHNEDGYTKTHFDEFTLNERTIEHTDPYTGEKTYTTEFKDNIIKESYIDFNGYTRSPLLDSVYYNKVQPYSYHSRSPKDGINMFSMSLFPQEQQPSGQGNLSRISKGVLGMNLNQSVFSSSSETTEVIDARIYTVNINILRFIGGLAGLAYIS